LYHLLEEIGTLMTLIKRRFALIILFLQVSALKAAPISGPSSCAFASWQPCVEN
jgi:hypothetical protein